MGATRVRTCGSGNDRVSIRAPAWGATSPDKRNDDERRCFNPRDIQRLGHEVRLIAPIYVNAFAKRQKSDARDAAAIVEAAQRPTMRFATVKTEEAQARAMVYRKRALLVRQRTQTVNAVRGGIWRRFGLVAPRDVANVEQLWARCAESLPELLVSAMAVLFERVDELNARIDEVDKQMRMLVREN